MYSEPDPIARRQAREKRRTQAERTGLSDARMLEAAIDLIVQHGVQGTTLKEVGEAAGYSRSLAGYRFGSKEGLVTHVVRSIGDEWLTALKQVTRGKNGLEAICAATDAHYRFCLDAPNHVLAFYILWFESVRPDSTCKDIMSGIHRRRQRDVAAWITEGIDRGTVDPSIDPDTIAGQFCSALIGIVYHWLVKPDATDQIATLHEGLKSIMTILLSPKIDEGGRE
jgi:AcrR family transcriptional regulator